MSITQERDPGRPGGAIVPDPAPSHLIPAASPAGTTVLIVDDSRTIRIFIRETLKAHGLADRYLEAENGREGLRLTRSEPVDLVLCDLEMPGLDGFGFLEEFRAEPRNATIPVLMLSSIAAPEKKVEGFLRGANDYIVKPCHPAELCARAQNYLRLKLLQDEIAERNQQLSIKIAELAQLAVTDSLTGLHNRRHFLARAGEELKRSRRHKHAFCLILMDVDHFKRVNDTYGHPQGDQVLVSLAQAFQATLRETDVVARLGGEEFVACLPETSLENALVVAERLRTSAEASTIRGMDRPVTISLGLSSFPAAGADSVDEMLRLADQALYRAKAHGRNRVEIARPG